MAINHVHIDETQSQKVTSSTVQSKGEYYILIHKLGGLEEGGVLPHNTSTGIHRPIKIS